MNSKALTEKIKSFALNEAGFDLVGITSVELPEIHERAITRWVDKGFAGTMGYMARGTVKRAHPDQLLDGARSVISLALNYYHPEDPKPSEPAGKVSKYAYGTDYHKIIEKKLKVLSSFIKAQAGSGAELKSYVDTGPILEKAFAKESGLGFFGKNTNLITREYGSWIFLASLVTNLELEADKPHLGSCGSCRICIDACPTDALLGNYEMDARKCISYLTIEDKASWPSADGLQLRRGVGEWIFGCDVCQEVCPYNFRAKTTRHEELYPQKKAGTWLDLQRLYQIRDEKEFSQVFQGSPLKRPKLSGLLRNAEVVLENQKARIK